MDGVLTDFSGDFMKLAKQLGEVDISERDDPRAIAGTSGGRDGALERLVRGSDLTRERVERFVAASTDKVVAPQGRDDDVVAAQSPRCRNRVGEVGVPQDGCPSRPLHSCEQAL